MKKIAVLFASLTLALSALAASSRFTLEQLQGAWWSDLSTPTADFGIRGDEVWTDLDSGYHPCKIVDSDILVFDFGPDIDIVKLRILKLEGDTLVLENLSSGKTSTVIRRKD